MIMVSTDNVVGSNNFGSSDSANTVEEAANWFDSKCDLRFYDVRASGMFVNLTCQGSNAVGTAITNSDEESNTLAEAILNIKEMRINPNG